MKKLSLLSFLFASLFIFALPSSAQTLGGVVTYPLNSGMASVTAYSGPQGYQKWSCIVSTGNPQNCTNIAVPYAPFAVVNNYAYTMQLGAPGTYYLAACTITRCATTMITIPDNTPALAYFKQDFNIQ